MLQISWCLGTKLKAYKSQEFLLRAWARTHAFGGSQLRFHICDTMTSKTSRDTDIKHAPSLFEAAIKITHVQRQR